MFSTCWMPCFYCRTCFVRLVLQTFLLLGCPILCKTFSLAQYTNLWLSRVLVSCQSSISPDYTNLGILFYCRTAFPPLLCNESSPSFSSCDVKEKQLLPLTCSVDISDIIVFGNCPKYANFLESSIVSFVESFHC